MWLKFIQLTPDQQITAQLQLDKISEPIQSLRSPHKRDFLIVDGKVKGSRIAFSKKDLKLFESLGLKDNDLVRSKTDLKDWKSTPTPFSITND